MTCLCGCGLAVEPRIGKGRPKQFWSQTHYRRWYQRKPHVLARIKVKELRRRTRSSGRACKWCDRTDVKTYWSGRNDECQACNRQRHKRPCGKCGGPFYYKSRAHPGVTGCVKCP